MVNARNYVTITISALIRVPTFTPTLRVMGMGVVLVAVTVSALTLWGGV